MNGQPSTTLFSAPYKVVKHEHVDDEFAEITVRCLGYPTHGTQPTEWAFALKVPKAKLTDWPLGAFVSLAVTA